MEGPIFIKLLLHYIIMIIQFVFNILQCINYKFSCITDLYVKEKYYI